MSIGSVCLCYNMTFGLTRALMQLNRGKVERVVCVLLSRGLFRYTAEEQSMRFYTVFCPVCCPARKRQMLRKRAEVAEMLPAGCASSGRVPGSQELAGTSRIEVLRPSASGFGNGGPQLSPLIVAAGLGRLGSTEFSELG